VIGILQSIAILLREKPNAIFSKGGYVSLPVALAGWTLRIPIYFHESDSIPGLANRIVAKFATGIFSAFPEADNFFEQRKILGHGPLLSAEIQTMVSQNDEVNE
jgi:UDP-N-acetylglucosamine--N-acetylmuramyl-(pentapeptide) pyrophosphoryl-undecaprenol N-acetylglucosamine transferase